MPHKPKPTLIETELEATLDRFEAYLRGTRFERRRALRAATARSYRGAMRQALRWAETLQPSVERLQAFMEHLSASYKTKWGKPLSDSSKRTAFFGIKAWFEWRRQPLTEEQERGFLVPPTPQNARDVPMSMDRIHELLGAIPDRRRYAIVRTLLATGMRRAELAALKVKHVDFESRKLFVPEIGEDGRAAAKGGRGGWVCISPIALDAIQGHLRSRKRDDAPARPPTA